MAKAGRPRTRPQMPREYVGLFAPKELKRLLIDAARGNGRSLSSEAQFRLERSFDQEGMACIAEQIFAELKAMRQELTDLRLDMNARAGFHVFRTG